MKNITTSNFSVEILLNLVTIIFVNPLCSILAFAESSGIMLFNKMCLHTYPYLQ